MLESSFCGLPPQTDDRQDRRNGNPDTYVMRGAAAPRLLVSGLRLSKSILLRWTVAYGFYHRPDARRSDSALPVRLADQWNWRKVFQGSRRCRAATPELVAQRFDGALDALCRVIPWTSSGCSGEKQRSRDR